MSNCLNYAVQPQHELKWFGKNLYWCYEREKHYWYQQEGWTMMEDCFLSQGRYHHVCCKRLSVAIPQWKITYLEFIFFFVAVRVRRNGKASLFPSLTCTIIDFTTICWESRVEPSVTASQRQKEGHNEELKSKQLAVAGTWREKGMSRRFHCTYCKYHTVPGLLASCVLTN